MSDLSGGHVEMHVGLVGNSKVRVRVRTVRVKVRDSL